MTQESFSELVGIDPKYCSRIECGISRISLERLVNICDACDVDLDYLARGVVRTDSSNVPYEIPNIVTRVMTSNDKRLKALFLNYLQIFTDLYNDSRHAS